MNISGAFVVALVVVWLAIAFGTAVTTGGIYIYSGPYLDEVELRSAKERANAGDARALEWLATHYSFTLHPRVDDAYRAEAEYWLERAAHAGNDGAIAFYAHYLLRWKLDCDAGDIWRARLPDRYQRMDWSEELAKCREAARNAGSPTAAIEPAQRAL